MSCASTSLSLGLRERLSRTGARRRGCSNASGLERWSTTRKPTRELPADDPFAFLDEIAEARRRRLQRETSSVDVEQ
jgi:hypothetical protein